MFFIVLLNFFVCAYIFNLDAHVLLVKKISVEV